MGKISTILEEMLRATNGGKLKWRSLPEQPDTFTTPISGYLIYVSRPSGLPMTLGFGTELTIADKAGKKIISAREGEYVDASSAGLSDGPYGIGAIFGAGMPERIGTELSLLYEAIRKSLNPTENALDKILGDLSKL